MKPQIALNIKKVTSSAFTQCAQLRHKLWPQDTVDAHLADITALYQEHPYCAFIAYESDEPIGFVEASMKPYVNGCLYRPVGFIEGLWIAPSHQHQESDHYIAKSLIAPCARWAKENGAQELASDAYLENTLSHQAHREWGFDMTEKVVYFRKTL